MDKTCWGKEPSEECKLKGCRYPFSEGGPCPCAPYIKCEEPGCGVDLTLGGCESCCMGLK